MYVLLVGYPPFMGANNKEILEKIMEGKVIFDEDFLFVSQ